MDVLQATSGGARLLNALTGEFDMHVAIGQPEVSGAGAAAAPSERLVLATRQPVLSANPYEGTSADVASPSSIRSALSVPMFAGDELIGALSVGSRRARPLQRRRSAAAARHRRPARRRGPERAAPRLHARAGKQQWEATFDAIGDPIAVFDARGRLLRGNAALGDAPRTRR